MAVLYEFVIEEHRIDSAITGLLDAACTFDEFSVADHRRGDCESLTTFRATNSGFEMKTGGHGWSGDWKPIDWNAAVLLMAELACYNYGPDWNSCGHIFVSKGNQSLNARGTI